MARKVLWTMCARILRRQPCLCNAVVLLLPAKNSPYAGIRLQDLPLEVLQTISRRLSAVEWARGPAQTCRLLSDMHLPRIALDPLERVSAILKGCDQSTYPFESPFSLHVINSIQSTCVQVCRYHILLAMALKQTAKPKPDLQTGSLLP